MMVGKNRFAGQKSGKPDKLTIEFDGMFSADDDRNSIDAIVYSFNADPEYIADETVNLSITVPARVGTRYAYRILTCDRENNATVNLSRRIPKRGSGSTKAAGSPIE